MSQDSPKKKIPFKDRVRKKGTSRPKPKEAAKQLWNSSGEFEMVATCMQNLEPELEKELKKLGAKNVKAMKRAVRFDGGQKLLYASNLWLRTALKVLRPIAHFYAKKEEEFYEQAKNLPWEQIFQSDKTFAIDASVYSEVFQHSQYISLKLKDAIVDRFREKGISRPSVDRKEADIRIHLHINQERVDLSLDSSGDPLFKRGYRQATHIAPINETLAAGMLLKSGYNGETDFLDPMCGSGTLAIEAAFILSNTPPNMQRTRFGFESWQDYDQALLSEVLGEAQAAYKPIEVKLLARDSNSQAIRACRVNVNAAQLRNNIKIEQTDFFKAERPFEEGFMISNPPYGERLQVAEDLPDFYEKIGSTLKHEYPNWEAWFISSDMDALKRIGLKPSQKIPLMNGKLECQLRKFELFEGKKADQ
ncbi:MAG: THUMP domain-containing protein [Vicingaceae bacterium]